MSQAINTYLFKVGNCTMSSKSHDKETAFMYLRRQWPTGVIEFLSESFSHNVGDYGSGRSKPFPESQAGIKRGRKVATKPFENLSMEERLEQALIEKFGG